MTIRSGGRPRDRSQAHPIDQRAYEEPWQQDQRRAGGRPGGVNGNGGHGSGGYGRRRRTGPGGLVRFLLFAVVLAAVVLTVLFTVLRPVVRGAILDWAADNPGSLDMPFVASLVREDLGEKLTSAASTDTSQVPFTVSPGESAMSIAERLQAEGFISDSRAFVFIAIERGLTGQLETGDFVLRRSMTPDELVTALLDPTAVKTIDIRLRTGLRLEQITALLQTLDGLKMDPRDFYELASHPTAELLADYDWLDLPEGASLEGYLWPATYRVLPDTTGEELVRLMLDNFRTAVDDRLDVPAERSMTFHQVLALASLVEREAVLDEERPLIAGVYQNRLDGALRHRLLQADPTVFYAVDTMELARLDFSRWREYSFWNVPEGGSLRDIAVPEELQGYQTYQTEGLIPGPICTPTLASIDAALAPDTADGYVYFLAKRDGSNGHAFAKNDREHQENLVKYGYR